MKVYTQLSRRDGDCGAWTVGVESCDRSVILNNIMERVGKTMNEDEYADAWSRLEANGRIHVDTVTYDIEESDV